jgi:uncharacterized membrane protein YhaH (DUF805 family)
MGSFLGGRSDRWEYWTSIALLTVAGVILPMLHVHAAVAALFVMWMVTWARRLHDIGISGWIAVIPGAAMILPVLLGLLIGGNHFLNLLATWSSDGADHVNPRDMVLLGFVLVSAAIQYGFSIWLGLKAGDAQDNRFGPARGVAIAKLEK